MSETVVRLQKAQFTYPKSQFKVICEDLELRAGETTLFTGKNGSGKTTLLKLCCGILRPDTGSLNILGEDAGKWPLGRIGKSIGYLFQEPSHQLFTATVWDEMTFVGSILGEGTDVLQERALSLLQRFNLIDLIERSIYHLSRGEKQRLAIAAILMQKISYLILDEPTTGLDKANRNTLYGFIDSMLNDGVGVAVITHDTQIISRYSGRRITMDNGRVIL